MPLPPNDQSGDNAIRPNAELNLVVANLLNTGGTAEGTSVPPQQRGTYRIPFPSGFKVVSATFSFGGNIFVLGWKDLENPATPVAGYRVYARSALQSNVEPVLVGSSAKSPCVCRVISDAATSVTFFLQPFLTSGSTLPLSACPTTTGANPDPVYIFIAHDAVSGANAKINIGGGLSWAGGTTVGLGITYPGASSPYDTAYATYTGIGMEAYINNLTLHANATGLTGGNSPSSTAYFFVLASQHIAGADYGYLSLGDATGAGGINGNGERIVLDGNTGSIYMKNGADTVGISPVAGGAVGAFFNSILVQVNGATKKIAVYNV